MARRALFALGVLVLTATPAYAEDCVGPLPGLHSLLKDAKVVFVGAAVKENTQPADYRLRGSHTLRVTEAFQGVKGRFIDITGLPWGNVKFQVGQTYLVFADSCPWDPQDKGCLATVPCNGILPIAYAPAIIDQLRAEKRGEPVASVYGMLWRSFEHLDGIWEEGQDHPLPNVAVRLSNGKKSFVTTTDEHGVYAFQELPKGNYAVTADLPPGLAVAQLILKDPPPPFELPSRSSFEYNIYVRPTGLVSGQVITTDGRPLKTAKVGLYQLNRYKEGSSGEWSFQGRNTPAEPWQPFTFDHLPPGDYVLVFNPDNQELPDGRFPRTFYASAEGFANSQIIHLAAGQQILHADIHATADDKARRAVTVRLDWGAKAAKDFSPPEVIVDATTGIRPYPFPNSPGIYTLNLLPAARYSIHALAYCHEGAGEAKTNVAVVEGGDPSVSEISLTFEKGECKTRQLLGH